MNRDNQDRFELENTTIVKARAPTPSTSARAFVSRAMPASPPLASTANYIYSSLDDLRGEDPIRVRRDRRQRKLKRLQRTSTPACILSGRLQASSQSHAKLRPSLRSRRMASATIMTGRRASPSHGPGRRKGTSRRHTVIRAGYGWFFDRFGSTLRS